MKTAEEMRKLCECSTDRILTQLEVQIEEEAKQGETSCVIALNKEDFRLTDVCAKTVVAALHNLGYTASSRTVYDQRDGDSVEFNISWEEKKVE